MFRRCNTSVALVLCRFTGVSLVGRTQTVAWRLRSSTITSAYNQRKSVVSPATNVLNDVEVSSNDGNAALPPKVSELHVEYFTKLLGLPRNRVIQLLAFRSKINVEPIAEYERRLATLHELGFDREDCLRHVSILMICPRTIRQRFECLKEIGISVIGAREIIRYLQIMSSDCESLRSNGILPKTVKPLDFILDHPAFPEQLRSNILSKYDQNMDMQSMRAMIVAEILLYRFDCDLETAQTLAKRFPRSKIRNIAETSDLLINLLELPFELIAKVPKLLIVEPQRIVAISDICSSHQIDLKKLLVATSESHLVITRPPDRVRALFQHFTQFGVPLSIAASKPHIFLMSPDTVLTALTMFSTWPEFPVLRSKASFVYLLKEFRRVQLLYIRSRSKSELELTTNLNLLTPGDSPELRQLLGRCEQLGKTNVTPPYRIFTYLVPYLAGALKCPESDIRQFLCRHPLYSKTPLAVARTTLEFLQESGFDREQILRGISLVVHPKTRVAEALAQLPSMDAAQPYDEWRNSPHLLQLLLYTIEKEEANIFETDGGVAKPETETTSLAPNDDEPNEKKVSP